MIRLFLLLPLLLPLASCSGEPSNMVISNVELRPPLGGRDVAAVYMDITNLAYDLELVGVSSPEADVIELHETTRENGIARMDRLDSFMLPYGETTRLQKGGKHLMVFGLSEDEAADGLELVLRFEDGSEQTLVALPREGDADEDDASQD